MSHESQKSLIGLERDSTPRSKRADRTFSPAAPTAPPELQVLPTRPPAHADADALTAAWLATNAVTKLAEARRPEKKPFRLKGHKNAGVIARDIPPPAVVQARTAEELAVLLSDHEPLARKVATAARGRAIPIGQTDDHLQAAQLGLLEAAWRFDPSKSRFGSYGSYARWYAREQCGAESRLQASAVNGAGLDERLDAPRSAGGDEPANLAGTLGDLMMVDAHGVGHMPGTRGGALPGSVGSDLDLLPSQSERLRVAMLRLTERERQVLGARHFGAEPVTVAEVAAKLGISTARVSELEIKGLRKLRKALGVADESEWPMAVAA
jgi:RNA polymerase sigma factor (sigma-70 family)